MESKCCQAKMIGGAQCEVCGADGREFDGPGITSEEKEWCEDHGFVNQKEI